MNTLFKIEACSSASSASGERSFSSLEQVLTKKRATMGEQRITSLVSIYYNRDLIPETDKIYEIFKREFPRINIYLK